MEKYRKLIRRAKRSVEYWAQLATRDFVRDLSVRMSALDINRAQLAKRIDVSPAYISRVMRGDVNFTLETMTKLAIATESRIRVEVVPQLTEEKTKVVAKGSWFAVHKQTTEFTQIQEIPFEAANDGEWITRRYPIVATSAVAVVSGYT